MGSITTTNQSGGINLQESTVTATNVAGRDISQEQIREALRPVADAISAAPEEVRGAANEKLEALTEEAAKGVKRDDTKIGKLLDGIVALVPAAIGAVVAAFGNPILGGLAGPVTKFVLERIKGHSD